MMIYKMQSRLKSSQKRQALRYFLTQTMNIKVEEDKSQCLGQILNLHSTILSVRQSRKTFYNIATKQAEVSLNEFIITAIEEKMKPHKFTMK